MALLAGLGGSLADSLAGATIQASYLCDDCGEPAETPGVHCGGPMRLVRGYARITNDAVNAIGTAAGALVGAALAEAGNVHRVRSSLTKGPAR
jgi:uncharacterized membrane protein